MKIQYPLSGTPPECECIDSVVINGNEYRINASFDKILRIFDLVSDETVSYAVRINAAIEILICNDVCYMEIEDKQMLLDSILKHYSSKASDDKPKVDLQGNPLPEKEQDETYRINYDGDIIYASFLQAYGIDLINEQGKMHWFKFCALLKGLPKDTKFVEICGYRSWEKPSKKDTHEKQMMKLKELYALPKEEGGD